jgi:hypothetical protein
VQLFTVRPDGSNVRQITTVQGDAVHADWAPNGRKLVFEFAGETHAGIALINPDGSGLPNVSPDGKLVTFVRVKTPEAGSFTVSPTMAASRSTSCPPAAASRATSCRCPWRRATSTGGHDRRTYRRAGRFGAGPALHCC